MIAPGISTPDSSNFFPDNRIRKYLESQRSIDSATPIPTPSRPRIGLALGGGGAKGAIHVGVFKALAELGIQVDAVAGTSVGAFVGAYYCAGLSPDEISHQLIKDFRVSKFWNWIPFGNYFRMASLLRKGRLQRCLRQNVNYKNIEELPTKFIATATDLVTGESVHIDQGCLPTAVAASSRMPGFTRPIEHNGRLLVDGGILENVPVAAAKAAGVDIVIAVDVANASDKVCKSSVSTATGSVGRALSVQFEKLNEKQLEQADIVIRPDTSEVDFVNVYQCAFELADIGQHAANIALNKHARALT